MNYVVYDRYGSELGRGRETIHGKIEFEITREGWAHEFGADWGGERTLLDKSRAVQAGDVLQVTLLGR